MAPSLVVRNRRVFLKLLLALALALVAVFLPLLPLNISFPQTIRVASFLIESLLSSFIPRQARHPNDLASASAGPGTSGSRSLSLLAGPVPVSSSLTPNSPSVLLAPPDLAPPNVIMAFSRTGASSTTSSPRLQPVKDDGSNDIESGYASASSSAESLPIISLTKAHLAHLNAQLENMHPMDILRFVKIMFPNLYQTTAFGLTGLVTLDMLAQVQAETPWSRGVDVVFLDTLYHFPETYELIDAVRARYPSTRIHVFKPDGVATAAEFEALYGQKVYETASEMYDWAAKVEPLQRAYDELKIAAVLTGRRRSQGGARDAIPVIELDEERGVVKINPLVTWSFAQVREYVRRYAVPYNALLDRGYKSVGDWHSTVPVAEGEDERAGRWKGQQKTECGIHNKKSRYAQFLEEQDRKAQEETLNAASAALERHSQDRQQQPQPQVISVA